MRRRRRRNATRAFIAGLLAGFTLIPLVAALAAASLPCSSRPARPVPLLLASPALSLEASGLSAFDVSTFGLFLASLSPLAPPTAPASPPTAPGEAARRRPLPPGIDQDFVRVLAAECPRAGGEEALTDTIAMVWRVARDERCHFLRLLAQIRAESDFDPTLVSSAGAVGLLQIIPETAADMGFADVRDPETNVRCGARYMAYLDRFCLDHSSARERWIAALACYNSGPGNYLSIVERTLRNGGTTNWTDVARTYRRRFRRARGQRLPETLIFVERNLTTLERFQRNLFRVYPGTARPNPDLVRFTPPPLEGAAVD